MQIWVAGILILNRIREKIKFISPTPVNSYTPSSLINSHNLIRIAIGDRDVFETTFERSSSYFSLGVHYNAN